MSGDAGRTALTIVGQVAGYALMAATGPAGAAIGAALGGYVGMQAGYALFPLDPIAGPRLTDARLMGSAYGVAIPQVFGAARVAGNVIWQSDIRETATTEEVGGKGGPSQDVTTYSYDADVAVGLCAGPMASVRRIWADGRLIYDVSDQADIGALQRSGEFAQHFSFYSGSETQLPDPTIEAARGVGQTPAYRGLCYVVFRQIPLADYGNRIPQFSFEVVELGSPVMGRMVFRSPPLDSPAFATHMTASLPLPVISFVGPIIRVANSVDRVVRVYSHAGELLSVEEENHLEHDLPPFALANPGPFGVWSFGYARHVRSSHRGQTPAGGASVAVFRTGSVVADYDAIEHVPSGEALMGVAASASAAHLLVISGPPAGTPTTWRLLRWDGRRCALERSGAVDSTSFPNATTFGMGPVIQTISMFTLAFLEADLRHLWQVGEPEASVYVWRIDADNVLRRVIAFDQLPPSTHERMQPSLSYRAGYADNALAVFIGTDHEPTPNTRLHVYSRLADGAVGAQTVGGIVQALCLRAGLAAPQIDTAALTQPCAGYVVGSSMTARGAIGALANVFAFHGVESGTLLRFAPKAAGASAATIPAADLGSGEAPAVLVASERAQETDLPSRVLVRYTDVDADYQPGAQSSRRVSTGSRQTMEIDAPVCMSATAAARAAEVLLADAWQARTGRRFSTSRKWAQVEPGDVVTLDTEPRLTVRVRSRRETGGRIEFDAADHAAAVFTGAAVGAPLPAGGALTVAPITRLELLDIPSLRATDDDAGLYVAALGQGAGTWSGARIERQLAASEDWLPLDTVHRVAVIGRALTVLPAYAGANRFDEGSSVDVQLVAGALAGATELQVLDGANAAYLGGELIQFREAVLVAGTTYRLSGLLRGRCGTEQFQGAHQVGETFVLLTPAGLSRLALPLGDVGMTAYYRALSFRAATTHTPSVQRLTHTGAAVRPLAPTQLRAIRLANDDVQFRWVRRARLNAEWLDAVDVPLDEPAERYDVEVLDAAAVVVLRAWSALQLREIVYTAAQQAADFGVAPSNINVRVYQRSSRVGRGFPAAELLSAAWPPTLRDWNDGLTTGQTVFGNASPSHSVVAGECRLNTNGGTAYSRLDLARATVDFDATVSLTATTGGRTGFVYRTTTYGGTNGMFAYAAFITDVGTGLNINILRGQNAPAGGTETTIASAFVAGPNSGWFRVRVRVLGALHELYVDGVLRASATDATFGTAGLPGLLGLAGTPLFDNLVITY